ncbi:MAG: DUF859 domain-containing protein [Faecalibacterium sp.]|jgi:hypothetical protein|nr:DUF859 domain-containing protein [Faecalibacterium sp.]
MAIIHFGLAFAESYFTINGSRALHLVITSDEPAAASILYSFDVTLQSTNKAYAQTFSVSMPEGSTKVTVPFAVPLAWANDFAQNLGDTAHTDACGQFWATMVAHYTMYAGSQQFTNDYKGYQASLSATVDESLVPTAGTLSAAQADTVVPAAWGIWVQGLSTARITMTGAAGSYGSTIVAYMFGNGAPQTENYADLALTESGNVTIPVTVQDSRGRTATADFLLAVEPYTAPALSGISSRRCDENGAAAEEGAYFLAGCTLTASALGGKNPAAVQCAWKKVTQESYGTAVTLAPGTAQKLAAALEAGASYDVKYTVSDAFHTIDYYDYISSTVYLLHFLKGGTGIAVGKAAEQANLFDVALETKLRRNVSVGGGLCVTGGLSLGGTDVGTALAGLGTVSASACTLYTAYLPSASENTLQKCGRLVLGRLHGTLQNGSQQPWEGETYQVATLPEGYFNAAFPALAFAYQNGKPCKAYTDVAGKIYVVPAFDGYQDTEVFTIGVV